MFHPGHLDCTVTVEKKQEQILYAGDKWSVRIHEQFTDVTINGIKGWGVTDYMYRHHGLCAAIPQQSVPMLKETVGEEINNSALTLDFTNPACASSQLVGGKGMQLALLTQLTGKFLVPRGFCMTVAAYKHHLNDNKTLTACIKELEDVAYQKKEGSIQELSKTTVESFTKTKLSTSLETDVAKQLNDLFSDEWKQKTFAVRSSAVGEDGGEASFAGQMETFLGVAGIKEICHAIVKCWASSFTQQAVEYRRNHGQVVAADVGVCVQEMVKADAAGVLFTRDPVSGNPGVMSINVSYGIGEAVSSGVTEPDTIFLHR
ncbi:PREDICTED: putative phosphoenolpyruvate synthase [Priapulus caudatus]|uniref:Phosphoenolpyruvate synthase n=1 Tax=Priapulus caudatus TaxID=37621 RepID=A0ABM1FAY5_PRICU|nr:PREDICTED: putative phosphoenolpyruvate synthase [Priapulus caudatus]